MNFQPPLKERFYVSFGYLLPIVLSGSMLSIQAALTVGIALTYYFLLRTQSRFVFQHVRQNINFVLSYYAYQGIVYLFIFLFNFAMTLGGERLQDWISEQILLQPLFFGGFFSTLFFMLLLQSVFYIALGVLILMSLMGKWTRILLVIRFVKKEMHEIK